MRLRTWPVTTSPSLSAALRVCDCSRACSSARIAAIDDHVFVGHVELRDAASDFGSDELFHLGGLARAGARRGHKGADADVDGEAALDNSGDGASHGELLRVGRLQRGPVARLRNTEARELVVALFIAAAYGDGKRVAGLYGIRIPEAR